MRFFSMKDKSRPAQSTLEASASPAIEARPQAAQDSAPQASLLAMPNEIKALIFGAIDVREAVGVKSLDNLRRSCRDLKPIVDDLVLRAITPYKEEADTDMAALREQLDGAWLSGDEAHDIHAARRHMHEQAEIRGKQNCKAHRVIPINMGYVEYVSSAFSPSGRYMAIGDALGNVAVVDMQLVKHHAKHDSQMPPGLYCGRPEITKLPIFAGSSAVLAFSADDKVLAVAHKMYATDDTERQAQSPWYVLVYDLTRPQMPRTHYIVLPAALKDISSMALDPRGQSLVLAAEGAHSLCHVAFGIPASQEQHRLCPTQHVALHNVCDGEVAYTPQGVLMCGVRGQSPEPIAALQKTALHGGMRRPFAMPRTSRLARRPSPNDASSNRALELKRVAHGSAQALELTKRIDGAHPQTITSSVLWDPAQTPSVLFAPGNRHVLVTSMTSGLAMLVDTAPPRSLEEADDAWRALRASDEDFEPSQLRQRRHPIAGAPAGHRLVRHAAKRWKR